MVLASEELAYMAQIDVDPGGQERHIVDIGLATREVVVVELPRYCYLHSHGVTYGGQGVTVYAILKDRHRFQVSTSFDTCKALEEVKIQVYTSLDLALAERVNEVLEPRGIVHNFTKAWNVSWVLACPHPTVVGGLQSAEKKVSILTDPLESYYNSREVRWEYDKWCVSKALNEEHHGWFMVQKFRSVPEAILRLNNCVSVQGDQAAVGMPSGTLLICTVFRSSCELPEFVDWSVRIHECISDYCMDSDSDDICDFD